MSATRDKSQRVTFVYSNLYKIYRAGVDAAKKSEAPAEEPAKESRRERARTEGLRPGLRTRSSEGVESGGTEVLSRLNRSHVLRSGQLKYGVRVREYQPTEFIAKRLPEAAPETRHPRTESPVESLKRNLSQLQELHSRLRFMLNELEDLSEDK